MNDKERWNVALLRGLNVILNSGREGPEVDRSIIVVMELLSSPHDT